MEQRLSAKMFFTTDPVLAKHKVRPQGTCVTLNRDLGSKAKFFERSYSQREALKTVGDGAGIVGDPQMGERAG